MSSIHPINNTLHFLHCFLSQEPKALCDHELINATTTSALEMVGWSPLSDPGW